VQSNNLTEKMGLNGERIGKEGGRRRKNRVDPCLPVKKEAENKSSWNKDSRKPDS